MNMTECASLVSCEWLFSEIQRKDIAILDASFFLARQQRNAAVEFKQGHIPGSQFFDIDLIADHSGPYPHTLSSAQQFARQMGEMGIDNNTRVIVYDNNAFFASARAWWMFRVFGHQNVGVLDGGLKRWKTLNFPLSSDLVKPHPAVFLAKFNRDLYCDLKQMQDIVQHGKCQILDARSPASFTGKRTDQPDLQGSGHIPGSFNIYYGDLRNTEDDTLLNAREIRRLFEVRGIDFSRPLVTTCGSGVSAAVLAIALFQLGRTDIPVYDGSWTEWSAALIE